MKTLTVAGYIMSACLLAGCTETEPGGSSTGFDRTADACDHVREAMEDYAASTATAADFETFVTALGYAVEGVQNSGDSQLVVAANDVERAANAGSYDAIAATLPDFISACASH